MIQIIKPLRLKCIKDDPNDKIIQVKDKDIQGSESLEHLIKKLEFDQ